MTHELPKPLCGGMKRSEITELLSRELVKLKLEGDANFLVMPVELWEPLKVELVENPTGYVRSAIRNAKCLLYGERRGKPGFFETGEYVEPTYTRTRGAAELLMCMMRAMIANSDDSCIDHRVSKAREGAF